MKKMKDEWEDGFEIGQDLGKKQMLWNISSAVFNELHYKPIFNLEEKFEKLMSEDSHKAMSVDECAQEFIDNYIKPIYGDKEGN